MNKWLLLFGFSLLFGCAKTEVQLPKVASAPLVQMQDYSEIFIFFDPHKHSAKLNRNGLITSTHWLFHVDRRNSFGQAAAFIEQMQHKKANPMNPHNNPNSRNFFSVADTLHHQLGFVDFTPLHFRAMEENFSSQGKKIVQVFPDFLILEGEKRAWEDFPTPNSADYLWEISREMTFQDFMQFYSQVLKFSPNSTEILYKTK